MKAVTASALSKTFAQEKKAVDELELSLEQGEVFGFLGPNGAGKTTTVKLLTGMLNPTRGACRVLDIDPAARPEEVHRVSGVVTEHAQMYDHMTGLENLLFYGALAGVEPGVCRTRARSLLERLELAEAADRKLAAYSTGMRQRLSLARAMLHRPRVLFLDEPTSGLDPESAQNVNQMIRELARRDGITIFLCTHQLRYAQEICTSYGLLDDGRLLAAGGLDALRALAFSGMTVRLCADLFPEGLPCDRLDDRTVELRVRSEEEIPALVRAIVERGGRVYHVSARQMSLEEIYFALLERRKKGEAVRHA